MKGGGEVAHGATLGIRTGETTTGAVAADGEAGEEGEGDAVDHHLRPGIEVKGHQRATSHQRPHLCTSELHVNG